ncbi:MAG: DUF3500 domain-containing protein [Pirellulales bacterium]|nr:DUF3500 domain-containing protein [Pirellulales bacterium]
MSVQKGSCPDGGGAHGTRRKFMKSTASVGLAAASSGLLTGIPAIAKDAPTAKPETLVQQLFGTLNDQQRKQIVFPFDHQLRSTIDNNWHITEARLGRDFNKDQQDLIRQIFNGLHSPEWAEKVVAQIDHDGGFDDSSIALFGEPGSGKFEFVLTGRHVTRRCDGDSVAGAAFGGPIFYGHAAESFHESAEHTGNVYWYQAKRANELFQALDGKQRALALLAKSRGEHGNKTVKLRGNTSDLDGIPVSELSADQKGLAEKVMEDLLAPFREEDRRESMNLIVKNGFDNLHLSYYKDENIGNDEVWDVWQVEGPAMVWYFRGKPHVHTWVHICESA